MCARTIRQPRKRRSGFVLVLTLLLLGLASIMLTGLANQSMQAALEATQQRDDLQRRWGAFTARRLFLDRADAVFMALDEEASVARFADAQRSAFMVTVSLGNFEFEIEVADEDAKTNLNTALSVASLGKVNRLAQNLALADRDLPVEVLIRPKLATGKSGALPRLETWEQVFALHADVPPDALRRATRQLTCWGSGRLNVRRASDDALREFSRLVVTDIVARRLMQERERLPKIDVAVLLDTVQLRPEQRVRLARVLVDRSSCYSVWITVRSAQRHWHEFHIVQAVAQPATVGVEPVGSQSFRSTANFIW